MIKKQRYTVITGASSGIGYATAIAFASRGKHLVVVARRSDRLEQLKAALAAISPHVNVAVHLCDLSNAAQAHQLYKELAGYDIETWVNNAGFGYYGSIAEQTLPRIEAMLHLNIEALTILSTLYVQDYWDIPNSQLINISSAGGYTIVPTAVTYCACKFYVSAFTEGLAYELREQGAALRAKVLAPAATKTEYGQVANGIEQYDYDSTFGRYNTSEKMADFLLELYDSEQVVGIVDRETFAFTLTTPLFPYAGDSTHNQKLQATQ